MEIFVIILFGLCIGSFLNVCISRIPNNESIVFPASHCPKCKTTIKPFDNIPVISYLALKGRCRKCGCKIPIRYLMVELITPIVGVFLYSIYSFSFGFLSVSVFSAILIIVFFIDLEKMIIPDSINIIGIILGFVFTAISALLSGNKIFPSIFLFPLLGSIAGALSIYLLGVFGYLLFKKEAVGGGDLKFMAMAGSFLGWKSILVAFFIAPILGSVAGLIILAKTKNSMIAYGPYLAIASFVSMIYSDRIINFLFPVF